MGFGGGWLGTGHTVSPAAKPPLIVSHAWQVTVGPGRADQAGGLGEADPYPHTGVGHQGTIVPHPGARVSPILLKRHIADALAKIGEDVGDLHEEEQESEDLWAPSFTSWTDTPKHQVDARQVLL